MARSKYKLCACCTFSNSEMYKLENVSGPNPNKGFWYKKSNAAPQIDNLLSSPYTSKLKKEKKLPPSIELKNKSRFIGKIDEKIKRINTRQIKNIGNNQ